MPSSELSLSVGAVGQNRPMDCTWTGCDRTDILARGLCHRCNMRARRAGTIASFVAAPRECAFCGAEFETGSRGQNRFCSLACGREAVDAMRISTRLELAVGRTCTWCAGDIPASARLGAWHCSLTCQQAGWYARNDEMLRTRARTWATANADLRRDYGHRRRELARASTVEPIDYTAAWNRDHGCCWICEQPVDRDLAYPDRMSKSWDHIVPLIRGGTHTFGNIALTHLRCNSSKKDRVLDRLPAWAS